MRRSMSLSRVIVPVAAEPNTIMRSGCVTFRMRFTISRANESSKRGRARSLSMRFMSVILVLQEASRQAVAFLHCLLDRERTARWLGIENRGRVLVQFRAERATRWRGRKIEAASLHGRDRGWSVPI